MNASPQQILLIEDNSDDVFFMRRALKKSGLDWSMQVVTDGQAAMDFLSGQGKFGDRTKFPLPALIFLDLKLPYVAGFEVLDWIRHQPGLRDMPVIILTSSPEERDQRRAAELGARAYLIKPPTENILRKVAEHWALPVAEQWSGLTNFVEPVRDQAIAARSTRSGDSKAAGRQNRQPRAFSSRTRQWGEFLAHFAPRAGART